MTRAARKFIGAATFRALTGRPVVSQSFDQHYPLGAHIELADKGQLLCVAPASADILAKAAQGLADDLLSTLLLSFTGPIVFVPAMNSGMWEKKSVQRNIKTLRDDGYHFVDPGTGWQSCRRTGKGRMAEPADIQKEIERLLAMKK
jgi:phosphopantothenoylcysteine decarboxylase/phosphopantothenate--cysteine ligase